MSDFKDILRSHNLRPTQQRVNLGKLLFGKLDRHITAEILKQESDYENLKVSKATVYNVLNDFYGAGLLAKVNIDDDKTWYDTNVQHHYHIFLENKSELVDIDPKEIDIKIPKGLTKGTIKKVDLVVKISE
ncbi:transcriptional repressor [Hyphomicrobiales bacterium]|nr:transcriptional repressor [Hyphomicrobiales bacterium]